MSSTHPDHCALYLDMHVIEALASWVAFGLPPGSFGLALLVQDEEVARQKAHELLKRPYCGHDIIRDSLLFVRKRLPVESYGSSAAILLWSKLGGLSGATIDVAAYEAKLGSAMSEAWFHRYLPTEVKH
jgi:hypothetical protein